MSKTLTVLLLAVNFLTVFCSDAVNYDSADVTSSSFSSSSSNSQSFSSVSSGTFTEDSSDASCDGPHEYYEFCEPSNGVVDDSCVIGCRCENNYVRNNNGECVSKEKFCRRPHETFSDCVNGGCDRRNCSDLRTPALCIDRVRSSCIQGCVCKKNHLRNVQGNCVPINHCPERKDPKCRGVNEFYENCAPESDCKTPCVKGCSCVVGYVRNGKGECEVDNGQYDTSDTSCDGAHEYYEFCETSSGDVDDSCIIGCRCENNYVRNDKGKCIAKDKFCHRPHETFSDCINGGCDRRNCSDLRTPALCIDRVRSSCIQGCVCKKNHLRNVQGNCVPINHCPERKDPKCRGLYEYYENCGPESDCKTPCVKGCSCVVGYVRNDQGECEVDNGQYTTSTTTTTTPVTEEPITTTTAPADVDADKALEKIMEGNSVFSQKFLQIKTNEKPNESFIASPFSVLIPLAEIVLYTIGKSFEQITRVLNVNNKDEIRQGMRRLLDNFKLPKNVTLTLAQKIYANKQFELSDNFKHDTEVYFDAEAENLDFSQRAAAARAINDWVKSQTNDLIPNLVDQSILSELTRLVLVNAIYFKGNWLRPFNPKNTIKKEFHITKDKNGTVDMMYQKGNFRYMESPSLQIKALELLYKDRDYSLLCVLPTSTDTYSLEGLAQKLQDPQTFKSIIDGLQYEEVRVYLPSIKTSTTTDLTDVFKRVNITGVLDPDNKDIVGILKMYQQLYISAAIQKAVVIINELGSEAAAANAITVGATAAMISEPKVFDANRPYYYFILYKKNILFCGGYTGA